MPSLASFQHQVGTVSNALLSVVPAMLNALLPAMRPQSFPDRLHLSGFRLSLLLYLRWYSTSLKFFRYLVVHGEQLKHLRNQYIYCIFILTVVHLLRWDQSFSQIVFIGQNHTLPFVSVSSPASHSEQQWNQLNFLNNRQIDITFWTTLKSA